MRRIFLLLIVLLILPVSAYAEKLAFLGFDGNYWQVFAIAEKGGTPTKLTDTPVDKTNISIDRQHNRLLYSTNTGALLVQSIKTGEAVELDVGHTGMTDATISSDGQQVAYSLSTTGSVDNNDIWLFHLKSKKLRKLTNEQGLQHHPAWSPDNDRLLFLGGDGQQNHDIFAIDIAGKSITQLTAGNLYNFGVDVSVRNEVLFSSNRQGSYDIYTMSLRGSDIKRLTFEPSFEGEPSWSEDGSKIVYVSTETGKRQLHIIKRDGSGKRIIPTNLSVRNPVWLK